MDTKTFYSAYPVETVAVVINFMPVCKLKQNIEGTPRGFTDIKSILDPTRNALRS